MPNVPWCHDCNHPLSLCECVEEDWVDSVPKSKFFRGDIVDRPGPTFTRARILGVGNVDYELEWLNQDGSSYYHGTCSIRYIDTVFIKAPDRVDSPGFQSKGEGFESPGGRQFTLQDMVSMVVRKRGLIRRLEKDIMEIEEEMAKMT